MTENENEALYRELVNTFRKMKHLRMQPPAPPGAPSSLTPGESHLMLVIIKKSQRGEKVRPADIADDGHMTPQALSPMLRKLEEEGLISRRMSNSDRRVSYIEPTEKGIKLAAMIDSMFDERMHDLVEYLGEEDVKDLIAILHKIGKYMDERKDAFGCAGHGHTDHLTHPHASVEGKEEIN